MLKEAEIKYIEQEIKDWKRLISSWFYNQYMNSMLNNDADEDDENVRIINGLKNIYNHILVYLEAKDLIFYAKLFQTEFSSRIKDSKEILKSSMYGPDEDPELDLLRDFSRFLAPFKAFDYSAQKQEEHIRLMDLLKSTTYIIKNTKVKITNETSIYSAVFWVLKLYYSSCRQKNKASFIKQFKTYNPDILIPEIETAIEYKYIRIGSNIDDYLDQVLIDAVNYKGDMSYEHFIAVLCMEDSKGATEGNIKEAWNSKIFPNNWHLVTVYLS